MFFLRRHRSAVSFSAAFLMIARLLVVVAATGLFAVQGAEPAAAATDGICYTVADTGGGNGGNDLLTIIDRNNFTPNAPTDNETNAGTGTGTNNIEAIALSPGGTLYAADANQLGIIDTNPSSSSYGEFDSTGFGTFGSGTGSLGSVTFGDVDGLTFDPFSGFLYGASRRGADDVLIKIDPSNGDAVDDAFGLNVDYVAVPSLPGVDDIDDIAIDPITGYMYGVINNGGAGDRLILIDKATGASTDMGAMDVTDIEGLGFGDDGTLWGTSGTAPLALYEIDKSPGVHGGRATLPRALNNGGDYESVECVTSGLNTISGTVFGDTDQDAAYATPDVPDEGAVVQLYRDMNGDGTVDPGDVLVSTTTTAANGTYAFSVSAEGAFVLAVDPTTLPTGHTMTTDNVETAVFVGKGGSDTGNDFGWYLAPTLPILKSVNAFGEVTPGQTLTYTVTVVNTDPYNHTDVTVTDAVPTGTTYVGGTTSVTAPASAGGPYITFAGNPPPTLASGIDLGPGQSATITFDVTVDALPGTPTIDNTASVVSDQSPIPEFDSATNNIGVSIDVTKTASSATTGEGGDTTTFTVDIENTSGIAVTVTSLVDDRFGDLLAGPLSGGASSTTCDDSLPISIAPTATFTCTIDATLSGDAGTSHINTVTARAESSTGAFDTDFDDATVTFTDVLPSVTLVKSASPSTRVEPGGNFEFTLDITNTSVEQVTITDLSDTQSAFFSPGCSALVGSLLPAGASTSCMYTVPHTDAGSYLNTASVTVQDNELNTASASDNETVTVSDVLPSVTLVKSASPSTRVEPGGNFEFTLDITNTSVEQVTITDLSDTQSAFFSPGCSALVGSLLPAGASTSCMYTVPHTDAGSYLNTASVTVQDNELNTASASDNETVTVTNVNPTIVVAKTVAPGLVAETGGPVVFTVAVENTSVELVTVTSLVDDRFGDLLAGPLSGGATSTTCDDSLPISIAPTATFTCTIDATLSGNAGTSHVNTVTAIATDGDVGSTPATDFDDATVMFTNAVPTIVVTKTVAPGSLPETGGPVVFTVAVENTSAELVTVTSLVDDRFGDLLAGPLSGGATSTTCDDSLPISIAPSATFTCTIDATLSGNAGTSHVNTVTAIATDGDIGSAPVADSDDATVTFDDVPPVVTVDKTSAAASAPEAGATVTFTVVVTNGSPEAVTLTDLEDDVFGDLLDPANSSVSANTCPAQSTALAVGGSLTCTFDGFISGDASGPAHENTVMATVVDDDGTTDDDNNSETVPFVDSPPSMVVDKSATASAVEAPGATVTFVVEVSNDGDEAITITSLTDDVFGDLLDATNAAVSSNTCPLQPDGVAVGDTFRCTFDGFVGGDGTGPDHVNTATAHAVDNEGTTIEDDDSATVAVDPEVLPAAVSGHVWLDLNPNLVFDSSEPPFSGLMVRIYNSASAEIGSVPVDASGFYEFTGLLPGDYSIVVDDGTVDPGYVVVLDVDGVNDLRTAFSLSSGEVLENRDFAYRGDAEIGDTVWRDDNRNGVQDPGEPGIAGAGAEVVWAGRDGVFGTADDYQYPKQYTNADGKYLFPELPPGEYVVVVDAVAGMTATTPTSFTVNLAASASYMNGDAGFAVADSTLPTTGADTDRLTRTGFMAIAFGAVMLLGAALLRRKRDEVAPIEGR